MKKIFRNIMAFAIAAMAFTACEDVPAPYDVFAPENGGEEVIDNVPQGSGTADDPYNAAGVIAYVKSLGTSESPNAVYIKGKVVSIKEQYSTQYGNATFYIGDETNSSETFYCYRVLYLGNKKFTSNDTPIAEGDEVVVYGKVVNFGGNTPETVQGSAYLYSLNGKTEAGGENQPAGEPKGDGTLNNPFNPAAAINLAKSLVSGNSDNVYIKGKIASIKEEFSTQFGNATFYISEDGSDNGTFYVFRTLYLGNRKFAAGDTQIKKGDEVIIYGKVTNYQGNTPETVQNESYIYSLNGKTEGGNGNPQTSDEVKKVTVAEFNAAAESTDVWYQLTGTVKNLKDGDQYGNFDLEDATGSVYVYGLLSAKGGEKKKFQELVAAKGIKEGSKITIIGNRGSHEGKIEVTNAYFVSIEGDNGNNDNPAGEVSGNTITVTFSTLGFENAQELSTITLVDGTTLTFDKGGNNSTPKYYVSGAAIRLYPKNSVTVNASKKIDNIVLTCSANNAEGQVAASPGSVNVSDMTVTVGSINANSVQISNTHTGTGATSQLRIATLVITYAE